ncbi:hypothetical protein [Saccharicrinis aurantiacus]|uniref:hypothetical protein n=1 Tax=Saccharicrinis aurantiacus TaxID=1849719 RepID=UPI00248F61C7|nr:hypothetical protein [Saccharicrinis aurantiacus]
MSLLLENRIRIVLLILLFVGAYAELRSQKNIGVFDEMTKLPIPNVNIQVLGKKVAYTSDVNGEFVSYAHDSDSLLFSVIGFESTTLLANTITDSIFLLPISYSISEILITTDKGEEQKIGRLNMSLSGSYLSNGTGKSIKVARYFKFEDMFMTTPYLKRIEVLTLSNLKNATFNIRLYNNNEENPGRMIYNQAIIGTAKKGTRKTKVDIEALQIPFPKEGLFVAIEWLCFEENIAAVRYRNKGSKIKHIKYSHEPSFALYKNGKHGGTWNYIDGQWYKFNDNSKTFQMKIILGQ